MSIHSADFFQSYVVPVVDKLGGIVHRDYEKARSNLKNNHKENQEYLGTYFPRTALESFSIFHYLADTVSILREGLANKSCLKVLDLGCGTGGELLGLLGAVRRICGADAPRVCIYAVDGNDDALKMADQVVAEFCARTAMHVDATFVRSVIEEGGFPAEQIAQEGVFDIILTSKFLNEVNDQFAHPYFRFAESFLPLLAEDGIAVFMDVTCSRSGKWIGIQMFDELGQFQRRESEFRTLFPMVCNNQTCCRNGCRSFPQLVFDFNNVGYPTRTKLSFRVMCRDALWQSVREKTQPARYWLKYTTSEVGWCREGKDTVRTAPLPEHCINIPDDEIA